MSELPNEAWPSETMHDFLEGVRFEARHWERRALLRKRRHIDTGLNDTQTQETLRVFRWKWVCRASFNAWRSSVRGVE